ncbi:MAG: putative transcriptional regulator [Verrucomicrobiales bacterium]|jgi:predicted transcriptional regulator
MSQSMRLSDELVDAVRNRAAMYHRSPPQQIEYWAAIGRVMESALSYPAEEKVLEAVGREQLDVALSKAGTDEGTFRAQEVIERSSGKIVSRSL